jgi:hypothetical protein
LSEIDRTIEGIMDEGDADAVVPRASVMLDVEAFEAVLTLRGVAGVLKAF